MNCNLCSSPRYSVVYKSPKDPASSKKSGESYKISEGHLEKPEKVTRCLECGLVCAAEAPLMEISKDYVEMEDAVYLEEENGRRAQAREVLSQISKYKKRGKFLDIGCGPGFLLDEARKSGWEVMGLDPSRWSSATAKKNFDIEVKTGFIEEADFQDFTFDVIVMNDVIEHLTDPKAGLKKIRRWLKNDGILYISTPDFDSFLSRLLRAKWWGVNKYHLFYFSKKTLSSLFRIVGFKTLSYAAYPRIFSVGYWTDRLKNYPWFMTAPFQFLFGAGKKSEDLLRIDLHDQVCVIARKVSRLDTVESGTQEEFPHRPKKEKVTAVLPAYNAALTLERTVSDISKEVVDEIILVDDKSHDKTAEIARQLGLVVFEHQKNTGYGGNQKTCYEKALERGAGIVVMVHPDYQYDPKIIPQLIEPIQSGRADAVFGSRMMKGGALEGGMPIWKHNANIMLTAFENVVLGTYLTEYHSGFRAYSARLLKTVNYKANSDGFLFDTEIIVQILANHFKIEEIPIRTRYFEEASSIKLWPSVLYGFGILKVMTAYFLYSKRIFMYKNLKPLSKQI